MAFYIKPTDGVVSLEKLQRFGRKRLLFLIEVLKCGGPEGFRRLISKHETAVDSECLIEGSKQDRTSHFLLRLVCSQDADLRDFLIQAETELFCYRISNMNTPELVGLLRSTHKFVLRCLSYDTCAKSDILCDFLIAFDMIRSSAGSWREVVRRYMSECSTETFQIPFQLSLSLVAGRQVVLTGGLARVPFRSLHVILSSIFHSVVVKGLQKAACAGHDDKRVVSMLSRLEAFAHRLLGKPAMTESMIGMAVSHAEIDQEMRYFPPCMKHLHRVLRQRHRLRHHSRIQYTLFLKEVGLPLQDAIHFWKREYSCTQLDRSGREVRGGKSWQKDRRRYTYSIRHLYGQEGSRVNYSAHSCRYLQTYSPTPGEEGGCPFSQADSGHLQLLMDMEEIHPSDQKCIQSLCQTKQYSQACAILHGIKKSQLYSRKEALVSGNKGEMLEDILTKNSGNGEISQDDRDGLPHDRIDDEYSIRQRCRHSNMQMQSPGKIFRRELTINCEEDKLPPGSNYSANEIGMGNVTCAISKSSAIIKFCQNRCHLAGSVNKEISHSASTSGRRLCADSEGGRSSEPPCKRTKLIENNICAIAHLNSHCDRNGVPSGLKPEDTRGSAGAQELVKIKDADRETNSSRTVDIEILPSVVGQQGVDKSNLASNDIHSFNKPVDIYRSFKKLVSDLQML